MSSFDDAYGADVVNRWSSQRKYELTKRKAWQVARQQWTGTKHLQVFQSIAKAWKDAYDIGFKEIDDGNMVQPD